MFRLWELAHEGGACCVPEAVVPSPAFLPLAVVQRLLKGVAVRHVSLNTMQQMRHSYANLLACAALHEGVQVALLRIPASWSAAAFYMLQWGNN